MISLCTFLFTGFRSLSVTLLTAKLQPSQSVLRFYTTKEVLSRYDEVVFHMFVPYNMNPVVVQPCRIKYF